MNIANNSTFKSIFADLSFKKICVSSFLYLAFFTGFTQFARAQQTRDGVAHKKAEVTAGKVRFTVLTPQMIRMEWSKSGHFEDRPSFVFVNRRLPVPDFQTSRRQGKLIINTGAVKVTYIRGSGAFNVHNLHVQFAMNEDWKTWHPGLQDTANLKGTIRTLDGVKGATKLKAGLLSKNGWHVIDDTHRPLFDNSDWPWVVPRTQKDHQDWYFLGYGHKYKKELSDYTKVAGKIPMPPRFTFGLWWSRWWAYTDQEFKGLVKQFHHHRLPLSVLVMDMDWHKTWGRKGKDQAGQSKGWTGYTWNPAYFPAPKKFLDWTKHEGLKVTMNLHPASGIQPYEKPYPKMARAMGMDPSKKKYIPFNITNKKFAKNYFKYVIDPKENQGVDFWWLDWQQWGTTHIPGVTPTWWLNYVFYTHMQRTRNSRPLIYHRYGGLGNHRYQIGFSGDVVSTWSSLNFQPYFTATAANVSYGYWTHDVGGFYNGEDSPELYTRWLQWGIFSPMVKTHVTKNASAKRRIWTYPYSYSKVMRKALLLRYKMIPYIYTASREAYDTGVSILRPLYYRWPGNEQAYHHNHEYLFGRDLLADPVTQPMGKNQSKKVPHALADKNIWLPPGHWVEWPTGRSFTGDTTLTRHYSINQIPVFARQGAIIPMQTRNDFKQNAHHSISPLVLTVFMGDSASARFYEDAGNTSGYKKGKYAWTKIIHREPGERTAVITVDPTRGHFPGMRAKRAYTIRLLNTWPAASVRWNGAPVPFSRYNKQKGWKYDGNKFATIIHIPSTDIRKKTRVTVRFDHDIHANLLNGMKGNIARLAMVRDNLNQLTNNTKKPADLVRLFQTGNRIALHPDSAKQLLTIFHQKVGTLPRQLKNLNLKPKDLDPLLKLLQTAHY